jgi:hypothetical protein
MTTRNKGAFDLETYDYYAKQLIEKAHQIETAKRPAYTVGSVDVHANFKRTAELAGITPGQVLAVFMTKHYDAILSALARPELPQAEEIEGRFADLINYAKLGYTLLMAQKELQTK